MVRKIRDLDFGVNIKIYEMTEVETIKCRVKVKQKHVGQPYI